MNVIVMTAQRFPFDHVEISKYYRNVFVLEFQLVVLQALKEWLLAQPPLTASSARPRCTLTVTSPTGELVVLHSCLDVLVPGTAPSPNTQPSISHSPCCSPETTHSSSGSDDIDDMVSPLLHVSIGIKQRKV